MLCRRLAPLLAEVVARAGPVVCFEARHTADAASAAPDVPSSPWPQLPLKTMPTKELKQLIQSTKAAKAAKPNVKRDIRLDQKLSQGPQQWEKLDCRVTQPFRAEDIALQDIFAVVEAGHTQFKGANRAPGVPCKSSIALSWLQECSKTAVLDEDTAIGWGDQLQQRLSACSGPRRQDICA